jgi:hypothetical protein
MTSRILIGTAALLGTGLLLALLGSADPAFDKGELTVATTPCHALLYLDGSFVSETSDMGDLVLGIPPGRHQIRATSEGHLDTVITLDLKAGESKRILLTLLAFGGDAPTVTEPILIGPSQTVRGRLSADDAKVIKENGACLADRFVAREKKGARRMASILRSSAQVEIELLAPDGSPVQGNPIPPPVAFPGSGFLEFEIPADGDYTLRVVAKSPGGMAIYALRYDKALPPRFTPEDPKLPGRRHPPPELAR